MFSLKPPIPKPASQVHNTNPFSWLMYSILFIAPIIIWPSFIAGLFMDGNTFAYLSIFILTYIPCVLAIGVYHRYYTHRSFKFKDNLIAKSVEFLMRLFTIIFGSCGGQGDVYTWVMRHWKHHYYEDQPGLDHHTPTEYKNKWKGFVWSHIGWLCYIDLGKFDLQNHSQTKSDELKKDPLVVFQNKYHLPLYLFFALAFPFLLAELLSLNSLMTFLTVNSARIACQHATFCVNSICHMFGSSPFQTYKKGVSKNNWFIAFLVFGEGFHNGHHAFSSSYKHGLVHSENKNIFVKIFSYILDGHARLIDIANGLGLLEHVIEPTYEERIAAEQKVVVFNLNQQILDFKAQCTKKIGDVSIDFESLKIKQKEALILLIKRLEGAIESLKKDLSSYSEAFKEDWKSRMKKAEKQLLFFQNQLQALPA